MSNVETPSSHEIAARDGLAQIRAILHGVRGFGFSGSAHRRRIGLAAAVPDQFLLTVAVALDASPELAAMAGVTGAQLRDVLSYTNAYKPFSTELALLANGVNQGVTSTRFDGASLALKVYRLAKGFNSPTDPQLLVPHIANMKAALGRGRPKTTATEPEAGGGTPQTGGANA